LTEIAPFQALRYNPHKISFISRVTAPPYDVIDEDEVEKLHGRDPNNVIRLILGKHGDEPRAEIDYEKAGRQLLVWRQQDVIVRDDEPSIYVLQQQFTVGEERVIRRGFISAVRLEEFGEGSIQPHEQTMAGPKEDRFRLMTACKAMLSQVFGFYSDEDGRADALLDELVQQPALYEYRDQNGIVNCLWKVSDPEAIKRLAGMLREEVTVIADGHHRYETALRYRQEMRDPDAAPGEAPEDYVPMFCVSVKNPGLVVLPTHRLVKAPDEFDADAFREAIAERFDVEEVEVPGATHLQDVFSPYQEEGNCIGCYLRGHKLLILRPHVDVLDDVADEYSEAMRKLSVAQLHRGIIEPCFDVPTEAGSTHDRLSFTQDVENMFWSVESGRYDAAFLLPSTQPAQVLEIASGGERMPPKSTYFYPKIPSGLVFYPYEVRHTPKVPE
jgi:uncharacterized protein (DUF1015 family)